MAVIFINKLIVIEDYTIYKDIVKKEDELWLVLLTMNTFYDLNEILTMLVEDYLRKKRIKDVKMMSMKELVLNGMVLSEEERKRLDLIYKYDCEKYNRE